MPEWPRSQKGRSKGHEAPRHEAIWYYGNIKYFDDGKGFGFISCPESYDEWQSDIFIHQRHLHGFKVGDYVTFQIQVNGKGKPQAAELHAWEYEEGEDYGKGNSRAGDAAYAVADRGGAFGRSASSTANHTDAEYFEGYV